MSGAQSTVWTQLSAPNSPFGSIPFVGDDNVTIKTDVLNFKYTPDVGTPNLTGSFKPKQLTVDGGLRVCFDDLTGTATPTSVTINKACGRFLIPAGQGNIRIFNTYCAPGALVFLQIESNDATLKNVFPAIANGSFLVTADVAPTNNCRIAFWLVNTF